MIGDSVNLRSKAISNTFYLTLDWFFVNLFSFLYSYVIWVTLPPENYGIVITSVNLMLLLSLITLFGLSTTLPKLIPEYMKNKQYKKLKTLFKLSFKIVLTSNLIILPILLIFTPYLASILKTTQGVIWLIIAGTAGLSFFRFTGVIVYAYQDMKLLFKTNFIGNFVKLLVSSILIFFSFRHFGPIIGVISGFTLIGLLRIKTSWFHFKPENSSNNKKIIFQYIFPAFIGVLAFIVFNNIHYVILTVLRDPEVTGIFSMAMIMTTPIMLIPNILNQAIFPIISQLCAVKGAKKKQAYLINIVLRYMLLFSLPFAILLIIFFEPAILFLKIKLEYLPSIEYLPTLSLASIIFGCGNIYLSSLYAIGKPKINRNITVLTAILFLVSSILLTHFFSAHGLSFSYLFSVSILFLLSFLFTKKYLSIQFRWSEISKIVFSSSILFLLIYIFDMVFHGFLVKIIFAIFSLLIYFLIFVPLKFYKKEDIQILQFFAERSPKKIKQIIIKLSRFLSSTMAK